MEQVIKCARRQDCYYKLTPGSSNETSINLSSEIFDFIVPNSQYPGQNYEVKFRIFKEDYIKALCLIVNKFPLYTTASGNSKEKTFSTEFFSTTYKTLTEFFGDADSAIYSVNLLFREDGRKYLNKLSVNGFNLREFLIENNSVLIFSKEDQRLSLRLFSGAIEFEKYSQNADTDDNEEDPLPLQRIYYGSPGTGKSRAVNDIIGEQTAEAIRTTFHPDSDYASFVGAYKPVMEVVGEKKQIAYKFVKQAFLKAYIKAWQKFAEAESLDNIALQYLVIEEINRGNCAQIFGDLFQLLDRNDSGYSEYPIEADEDLAASLAEVESENNPSFGPGGLKLKGFKMEKLIDQYKKTNGEEEANAIAKDICVGKRLAFPPNLHILATMNTSDQSLFPMDSAFKRRWEWKYVPIKYDEPKSKEFTITIGKESNQYKFNWIEFLKAVNDKIIRVSQSEDKLLGNFFIKGNIGEEEFKGKVMFYIWSEVCKEEFRTDNNFMRHLDKDKTEKISNAESRESAKEILQSNMSETGPEEFSFSDLYGNDGTDILLGFMYNLGVLPLDHKASQPTEEPGQTPAASTGAEGPAEGDSESQE